MFDLLARVQQALSSRYAVEKEVGHGGMATIFLARDTKHQRRVAVKVLRPEIAAMLGGERFLREIEIASSLTHPHILPIHDSGEEAGLLYYVMPFVEGESLRDRLAQQHRLPLEEAVRITRDVASALAYAHAQQVLHRDIKPDNILLVGGHAVVADFGIARAVGAVSDGPVGDGGSGRLTETGLTVGTPEYMSPEQASGQRDLDGRSDLYSLGCVLYEMLTGEPPLTAPTAQGILAKRLTQPVPPLGDLGERIPPGIEQALMKALSREPADRFTTLTDFSDALGSAAALPVGAVPSRGVRAMRGRAALFVSGVLVTLATAYVLRSRLSPGPAPSDTAPVQSIAVLPLVNVGGDPSDQYFSAGMTEELGNALTKVAGLKVLSRTSAYSEKAKAGDAREIGRSLNVSALLEGTVRREGRLLRVSVELTSTSDGLRLWSETYERELKDVFSVQDDIAKAVAAALKVRLAGGQATSLVRRSTENPEAHDLYLQGRYFYEKRTEPDLRKAAEFFQRAIQADSTYALAYSGLADSYAFLATFGFVAPKEAIPQAKSAALKAIALDSTLPEAHTSLAFLHLFYDWDWPGAEAEFARAIGLDSTYAPARLFHSWYYLAVSRPDDAVREIQRARALDPLSLIINTRAATMLHYAKRYDEAIAQAKRTLELDSTYDIGHAQLARTYLALSRCPETLAEFAKSPLGRTRYEGSMFGYAYSVCGHREKALAALRDMEARKSKGEYVTAEATALVYLGLGERDRAFEWLNRAVDERDWSLYLLNVEPLFDRVRSDPRFAELVRRVGLPAAPSP